MKPGHALTRDRTRARVTFELRGPFLTPCARRGLHVPERPSRHAVPDDPTDSPLLRAALAAEADYLVTNDTPLLGLTPYEGLRILSVTAYYQLLTHEGLIS